jgi:hypothetical protein
MDVTALAKVIDENNILFEDVVLTVKSLWFVSPVGTTEVEIDLNIVANAENKTISFAPNPGVMEALELAALREVYQVTCFIGIVNLVYLLFSFFKAKYTKGRNIRKNNLIKHFRVFRTFPTFASGKSVGYPIETEKNIWYDKEGIRSLCRLHDSND